MLLSTPVVIHFETQIVFSLATRSSFTLCHFALSPSLTQQNSPGSSCAFPVPALESAIFPGALVLSLEMVVLRTFASLPSTKLFQQATSLPLGSLGVTEQENFLVWAWIVHPRDGNLEVASFLTGKPGTREDGG